MQCEEFEDRINAVLDERGRPEWDAELRLHCETCPDCRALAAAYGVMLDGYYTLFAAQPPADLAARVLADSTVTTAAAPLWQRRTVRRVSLAAAALATAAGLVIAVRISSTDQPLPQVAQAPVLVESVPLQTAPAPAEQALPALAQEPAADSPQLADSLALKKRNAAARAAALRKLMPLKWLATLRSRKHDPSKSDPYKSLAKQTGRGLATLVLQVPGFGGRRGIIDARQSPPGREPAWAVQLSEGLQPVTESVTETFNILLRTFPMSDLTNPS